MAYYNWKGIQNGQYKEGEIEALTRDEATHLLRQDKVIITSIDLAPGSKEEEKVKKSTKKKQSKFKKIPQAELITFTKKLETMVRSGLPFLETIAMLRDQTTHPGMLFVLSNVYEKIESGTPLSESLAAFPDVFDNIYINMIKAGESSGKIDTFLKRLVIGMEKTARIKSEVKGALTYPTILLIVAIAVIATMMIFVVPIFQDMYKNVEGGLPGPTQLIVDMSDFIRNPLGGGLLLAVVIGAILLTKTLMKTSKGFKKKFDAFTLKLPIIGELVKHSTVAKLAMIQGNLTAAGVSVIEALDISASSSENLIVREAMANVKKGVYSGEPLSELFKKQPEVFDGSFNAMVAVGEKTGQMEEMFSSIAGYYEEETDASVKKLTGMLEPIMIVFLGGTVGFILVAMYAPMFSMGKAMGV